MRLHSGSIKVCLVLILVAVVVGSAGAIHERTQCWGPCAKRPVFGTFTIYCGWRSGTLSYVSVCEYLTHTRARLEPLSRVLLKRVALVASKSELDRLGSTRTAVEIDVLVFGRFFPWRATVLATEFSNPNVQNLKPRAFTGTPPPDVVPLWCTD